MSKEIYNPFNASEVGNSIQDIAVQLQSDLAKTEGFLIQLMSEICLKGCRCIIIPMQKTILIDPDGSSDNSWLYTIIKYPTNVKYQQQYGGFANRVNQVEGFLVPVSATQALKQLQGLFEKELKGNGTWGQNIELTEKQYEKLSALVETIPYWGTNSKTPHNLEIDTESLKEIDEAWIPIVSSDGPGVLVWANSD